MNLTIGLKWVREDIADRAESEDRPDRIAAYEDAIRIIDTHQKRLTELAEVISHVAHQNDQA